MERLKDQVKKFLGLAPYDGNTNFVKRDGYFYASICKEFGKQATEECIEEMLGKANEKQ